MATIITNYTAYDMRYYYADTKRLPRLSKEEERQLIALLAAPTPPSLPAQQMAQVKQRLIEGHLGLATCIAADLCPRRCRDLYPDLVQEANLALIQATNRCDYSSSGNFTAYVAAWMRGRVKQALADDSLIKIDYDARQRVLQGGGTLDELRALQHPLSLDCLLDEHDPDSTLLDSLEAPSQPTTPVCDPQKHEQVEALLSYLSPRAQTILRLRYGLVEGDACPHTEQELARALGISCDLVHTTAYDALLRLRALVRGQATISNATASHASRCQGVIRSGSRLSARRRCCKPLTASKRRGERSRSACSSRKRASPRTWLRSFCNSFVARRPPPRRRSDRRVKRGWKRRMLGLRQQASRLRSASWPEKQRWIR